jgi:hypothetical protein
MRYQMNRILFLLSAVVALASPSYAQRQVGHMFPSDDEINLMVSQVDRAMGDYKALLAQGQQLLGESPENDTKVLETWEFARKVLRVKPQGFNSVGGFDVVTMLDDASRNAAIWASSAAVQVVKEITSGKLSPKTDLLVTLIQNANSTSNLLYTVSENAAALYTRYLSWQEEATSKAVSTLQDCSEILRKPTPKNQ